MAEITNSEPAAMNIRNLNSERDKPYATYKSEQKKYIQGKTDQITYATTNQKSSQAWKVINEISTQKRSNKSKLRAKNNQNDSNFGNNIVTSFQENH